MAIGAAGLAGLANIYPGFTSGMQEEYKLDDLKRNELAKVAMGNALQLLSGGQQQQGPQPGAQPPQQPFGQPQRPPMAPPGGMPPPGARPPGVMPPGAPQGGGAPMPMRPPMPAGGPGPGMGGPPGGAPAQGGPPQMPQGMQQPGGQQLDWRQLVAAVTQANPNIKPDVIAEAVNQFLPLMSAQSQQEWKMVSLQLREQALQQREQDFLLAEQGRNKRAEGAEAGRTERAEKVDKRVREGQEEKKREFETREARLQDALTFRKDSTYQRLQQQADQAAARVEQTRNRNDLIAAQTAINAADKAARREIQAYSIANNIPDAERKRMLEEADKKTNDAMEIVRNSVVGQKAGKPKTSSGPNPDVKVISETPAAPAPVPVPEAFKADPDGTTYQKGGVTWTKKGAQLVPGGA